MFRKGVEMPCFPDAGIDVIVWFQKFSPSMDLFFKALTVLGNEAFFLISLPFIYWCLCKRTGARLSVLFLLSAYINTVAKLVADQPRPFEYSENIRQIVAASGGGFPSGHTQNAVVFWGYLAWRFKNRWLRTAAALLIIGIPLSRIYLGVHFPCDLVGGYLIGTILLFGFLKVEERFESWRQQLGFNKILAAAFFVPAFLALIMQDQKTAVSAAAALFGLGTGFLLEHRYLDFEPAERWRRKGVSFVLGILVMALLYVGLKKLFSGLEPAPLFRFLRYGIVGLWGGAGAPWMFSRAKLSGRENKG